MNSLSFTWIFRDAVTEKILPKEFVDRYERTGSREKDVEGSDTFCLFP